MISLYAKYMCMHFAGCKWLQIKFSRGFEFKKKNLNLNFSKQIAYLLEIKACDTQLQTFNICKQTKQIMTHPLQGMTSDVEEG